MSGKSTNRADYQRLMKILGIDPGYAITGFGLIEAHSQEYVALDFGAITTKPKQAHLQRIKEICLDLTQLIAQHHPDCLVIEKLFFSKNVKTALPVAELRGAILFLAAQKNLPVFEYAPNQVKMAVCGNGQAVKSQIEKMVTLLLKLPSAPQPDDVADALAIAICHAHQNQINAQINA